MNNRINQLFQDSKDQEGLLNVYFTAGFPKLDDTRKILSALQRAGADMVEIGIPYSDPVADGETIQQSNQKALENGMTVKKLLLLLEGMLVDIVVSVLLMGCLKPILSYGVGEFCRASSQVGVFGLIRPDLPL